MRGTLLVLGALVLAGVATGFGQVNTTAGAHVVNHGRVNSINDRENKIMQKMKDGEVSGALVPMQVDEFKRRYNQIQSQKTNAMSERHGGLSYSEWKDLKKQEEKLERDIDGSLKH